MEGKIQLRGWTIKVETKNMIWGNSTVASDGVVGVVVYTGGESKSQLNNTDIILKQSKCDQEINQTCITFISMLLVISLVVAVIKGGLDLELVVKETLRFVILFSYMIPISMKITVDFSRVLYIRIIKRDETLWEANLQNSSIPEELGRVQCLVTDKTGTLT